MALLLAGASAGAKTRLQCILNGLEYFDQPLVFKPGKKNLFVAENKIVLDSGFEINIRVIESMNGKRLEYQTVMSAKDLKTGRALKNEEESPNVLNVSRPENEEDGGYVDCAAYERQEDTRPFGLAPAPA